MMKTNLQLAFITATLFFMPNLISAQAPNLGTAADFVLFTTNGPVDMTSTNQLTGNVGTNNGTSTTFNNVNGQIHDADGVTAQCAVIY